MSDREATDNLATMFMLSESHGVDDVTLQLLE